MANGRKLLDDVSMSELQAMRDDEGLTNEEIAQRVGVSKMTIYRLLGKQPPELRAAYGSRSSQGPAEKGQSIRGGAADDIVPASLIVESKFTTLVGQTAQYEVNETTQTVLVKIADDIKFFIDKEQLDEFIKELEAIKRHLKTPAPMEVW